MAAPDWEINRATRCFDSHRIIHTTVHYRIQRAVKSLTAVSAVVNREPLWVEHEHIASPGDFESLRHQLPIIFQQRKWQIECTGDLPTKISCIQQDEVNTLVSIRRVQSRKAVKHAAHLGTAAVIRHHGECSPVLVTTQLVKSSTIVQQRKVTDPIEGSLEGPAERRAADQRKK